ncbi:DUF2637 domain-containing protein [Nocardiopsis sp. TNDT3]|uniref:DUF2637 domain-containing protein n=1 Tax=Nocardiopsis sp. TNDT3 TaxID=2249354 RepID=UPI001E5224C4|nr:DUF2637 domain-containing protein [Nocardiopsis sp. TNDT3]
MVCGVAVIAAIFSYRHAYDLVTECGEGGATAIMILLAIDGLVCAASMAILHSARVGVKATPWHECCCGPGLRQSWRRISLTDGRTGASDPLWPRGQLLLWWGAVEPLYGLCAPAENLTWKSPQKHYMSIIRSSRRAGKVCVLGVRSPSAGSLRSAVGPGAVLE